MAIIRGRMVIGLREWRLRVEEEMEWGTECVNDGEEIGRVRERCRAMRMDFERKNGNGMDGVCRSDY